MTKKNFEQSMKDLEKIVEELESGEIPLEKALKKFEEGIKLSNFCAKTLDETEAKITMLIRTPCVSDLNPASLNQFIRASTPWGCLHLRFEATTNCSMCGAVPLEMRINSPSILSL